LGGTWSSLTADGTADLQNAAYDIEATGTPTDINSCFVTQAGVQNDMYFTSAGYKVMAYEWWSKIQPILP
jgi:hypothetical protein